jgi:hypothetical protein
MSALGQKRTLPVKLMSALKADMCRLSPLAAVARKPTSVFLPIARIGKTVAPPGDGLAGSASVCGCP